MKSALNIKESLLRRFILVGFSHPKASFFLLRGQATWMWRMWKMQEHFSTKERNQRKGRPAAA
jgi:hypothetical protein